MGKWVVDDDNTPAPATSTAAPADPDYGLWEGAKDVMRIGSNTLTYGGMDRVRGAIDAATTGKPYGQAVDEAVKRSEQSRSNVGPFMSSVGDIIGGGAAGAGLAKSGLTWMGRAVGEPLLKRMGIAGTEAALHGAAQGAGHTYSGELPDYIKNATIGAAGGAVLGSALPAVGAGGAKLYNAVSDRFSGIPVPVLRAGAADVAGLQGLPKLGPDAMLADAGPSMQATAQAAVQGTGKNRTDIVNALMARDKATVPRLQADRTAAIGPAPRYSQVEAAIDADRKLINANDYTPILQGRAVSPQAANTAVAELTNLGRTSRVDMTPALKAITLPGSGTLPDLSAQTWMQARHNIDSQIRVANKTGDRYTAGKLTDARNIIDRELQASVPGIKAADAKFAANRAELEGLERGTTVLDKGKGAIHPDDLRDVLKVAPPVVGIRMRQGAHTDLERRLGTQANDLTELEKTIGTPQDWNALKMRALFGDKPAQAIADSVARNRQFRETNQRVTQGSDTAQRIAAREDTKLAPTKLGQRTLFGTVLEGGGKAIDAIREASQQQMRDEIARVMALRNPAEVAAMRDRILAQNARTSQAGPTMDRLTRGAVQGGVAAGLPALYIDEEQ